MKRFFSLFLGMVFLFMGASSAAAATPTPAPLEITKEVVSQVPDQIQRLLDLAYAEWEAGEAGNPCNGTHISGKILRIISL